MVLNTLQVVLQEVGKGLLRLFGIEYAIGIFP